MKALLPILSMLAAAPLTAAEPPAAGRVPTKSALPCVRKPVTWTALSKELERVRSVCAPVKACSDGYTGLQSKPIGVSPPYLLVGATNLPVSVADQNQALANAVAAANNTKPAGKQLIWISFYTGSALLPNQTRLSGTAQFGQCGPSTK